MTGPELDRLTILGRAGKLTPEEQCQLADAFDEYRGHALRLERAVHDAVKKLEQVDLEAEDIDNQINLRLKAEQELESLKRRVGI
jgi:hypothetical protein